MYIVYIYMYMCTHIRVRMHTCIHLHIWDAEGLLYVYSLYVYMYTHMRVRKYTCKHSSPSMRLLVVWPLLAPRRRHCFSAVRSAVVV